MPGEFQLPEKRLDLIRVLELRGPFDKGACHAPTWAATRARIIGITSARSAADWLNCWARTYRRSSAYSAGVRTSETIFVRRFIASEPPRRAAKSPATGNGRHEGSLVAGFV